MWYYHQCYKIFLSMYYQYMYTYLFTHVYTNTYKVKCYIHYKTYTKIEHFKGWVKIIVNRCSNIHFSHSSGAQAHQHENHCTSQ